MSIETIKSFSQYHMAKTAGDAVPSNTRIVDIDTQWKRGDKGDIVYTGRIDKDKDGNYKIPTSISKFTEIVTDANGNPVARVIEGTGGYDKINNMLNWKSFNPDRSFQEEYYANPDMYDYNKAPVWTATPQERELSRIQRDIEANTKRLTELDKEHTKVKNARTAHRLRKELRTKMWSEAGFNTLAGAAFGFGPVGWIIGGSLLLANNLPRFWGGDTISGRITDAIQGSPDDLTKGTQYEGLTADAQRNVLLQQLDPENKTRTKLDKGTEIATEIMPWLIPIGGAANSAAKGAFKLGAKAIAAKNAGTAIVKYVPSTAYPPVKYVPPSIVKKYGKGIGAAIGLTGEVGPALVGKSPVELIPDNARRNAKAFADKHLSGKEFANLSPEERYMAGQDIERAWHTHGYMTRGGIPLELAVQAYASGKITDKKEMYNIAYQEAKFLANMGYTVDAEHAKWLGGKKTRELNELAAEGAQDQFLTAGDKAKGLWGGLGERTVEQATLDALRARDQRAAQDLINSSVPNALLNSGDGNTISISQQDAPAVANAIMRMTPDNITKLISNPKFVNSAANMPAEVQQALSKSIVSIANYYPNVVNTALKAGLGSGAAGKINPAMVNGAIQGMNSWAPEQMQSFMQSIASSPEQLMMLDKLASGDMDIPGVDKQQLATLVDKVKSACMSRAWEFAKDDPINNIPKLVTHWISNRTGGWEQGTIDTVSNPWVFYGGLLALVAGGAALLSSDESGNERPRYGYYY